MTMTMAVRVILRRLWSTLAMRMKSIVMFFLFEYLLNFFPVQKLYNSSWFFKDGASSSSIGCRLLDRFFRKSWFGRCFRVLATRLFFRASISDHMKNLIYFGPTAADLEGL